MRRGFDGGDLVILFAELVEQRQGIERVFPADRFFGAERGLANSRLGRTSRDSGQQKFFGGCSVGSAKNFC